MKREPVPPQSGRIRQTGQTTALLASAMAFGCMLSFFFDSKCIRQAAEGIVAKRSDDREKIIALAEWVHQNKGSRENESYFLFRSLRATPLRVMEGGGDCADKSRLLWAMLREVRIKSTMVMCFHRETGVPTHTVVEAETQGGERILVDPAYGLNFPKKMPGEYYGLLDLRADPRILDRRLNDLHLTVPPSSPLRSYNPTSASYDHASSINWNKNLITKSARMLMACWYGDEVYRLSRPIILEEPKLFVATIIIVFAAFVLIASRVASTISNRIPAASEGFAPCGR